MTDFMLGATWLGVLLAALASAVTLRALGVASTYLRDMLHVGAGIWVIGWPWWHGATIPIAIVVAVAVGIAFVPVLARRITFVERIERSVTNGDEHWGGLVLYTVSYAVFTAIGLTVDPFPAAAALLALSFGDGIGGMFGRLLGEHHYRAPGGKQKSVEGSMVVACGALAGALVAAVLFGVPLGMTGALVLGVIAAIAEGIAPRGTDNVIVPAAVYVAAHFV
jgi:dolichol kinase